MARRIFHRHRIFNFAFGKDAVQKFFAETLERLSPDFQRSQGYEIPAPGQANMSMSTTQLAERYGCVSMTLEMPFKDNFDLPDEVYGWSPQRSKYLGYACLDALHGMLPELKKATAERDNAKREKVTVSTGGSETSGEPDENADDHSGDDAAE